MTLEVAMDLMQPRLIQRIIDQGIEQNDLAIVLNTIAIMVAIALIGVAGGMGATVFAVRAAQGFGADLRSSLFRHVQSFSFGNLDELETGKLITRLTNDVIQVQEMVMLLLRIMVRAPLMLVGSLIMAILTSPQLALLFVVLIPIVLAFLIWIINKTFPHVRNSAAETRCHQHRHAGEPGRHTRGQSLFAFGLRNRPLRRGQ